RYCPSRTPRYPLFSGFSLTEMTKFDIPMAVIVHPIVVAQHAEVGGPPTAILGLTAHLPPISGDPVSQLEKIPAAPPGYQTQVQSWISIQTGVPLDDEQAAELQKAVAVALADTRAADDDYDNLKMAATRAAEAPRSESPESAQGVE